jgi:hypothetical protein
VEEVGKLLPAIFKKQMRREEARVVEVLGPFWVRVAGRGIAEHSRPIAFVTGTLTLETSCPAWAAQLWQMQEDIRTKINGFLGCPVVKKVDVRLALNLERSRQEALRNGYPVHQTTKPNGTGRSLNITSKTGAPNLARSRAKMTGRSESRVD